MKTLVRLNSRMRFLLAFALLPLVTAVTALGMSGTDHIASRGKPVAAPPGWPEGVLDLVNDPLRAEGWKPWFSGWPNDVSFYAFEAEGTNDLNRLIARLAAIKAERVNVLLVPAREPRALGFTTVLKEGNGASAVFSIGDQQRINEWYEHLREAEPGIRKFGVHRYREAPKAQPPTLTLYAGNEAIDFRNLQIPPQVNVTADISADDRAAAKNADLIKAIESFVGRHQSGAAKPAFKQQLNI